MESIPSEFKPLAEAIWRRISIHANHQQRCENYVQLAGLIALTGVSEVRRSCRAISVSAIVRRFNQWAIIEKNKRQEKQVKRLQGSDNDSLYFEYLANFFKQVDEAKSKLGQDCWDELYNHISTNATKASKEERDNKLKSFEANLAKKRKIHKAELPTGVEQTARVGEAVYLRILTKTNKMEEYVHDEMRARELIISDDAVATTNKRDLQNKVSESQLKTMTIAEKRAMIRKDEYLWKIAHEQGYQQSNPKETDIRYFTPQSESMRNDVLLGGKQEEILDKELGIYKVQAQYTKDD